MLWPRPCSSPDADVEAHTATGGDEAPFWTQNATWTAATETDYNDQDDDHDDDDEEENIAWSQSPWPAWEHNDLPESPFISSAQPVFYPFSLPASGIRPLTPPSPVRQQVDSSDPWVSELDSDSEVDDMLDDLLQGVSAIKL